MAARSDDVGAFKARVFKVSSLAGGGVSLVLHIGDDDSEPVWELSRRRGQNLMVAVEEIGAD